jgi:hypothetical protein
MWTPTDLGNYMSNRPASPTSRCRSCGAAVTEIHLLIDDRKLMLRPCVECDTRSWHNGDEPVELATVLDDLGSTNRRYRRELSTESPYGRV